MFLFTGWKWQRGAGQKPEVGFTSTTGSQELRSCEEHSNNDFLKVLPESQLRSLFFRDFPGSPVVKNLSFYAGVWDLIPGPETKIPCGRGPPLEKP